MSPRKYHHACTKLKCSILERIGILELSFPTGCAAVAAVAAAAAIRADGNGTAHNPPPEDIFVTLVHVMFEIFKQVVITRGSLANHHVFGAIAEPILVCEHTDCRY
jgi:hypothetical protein